MSARKPLPAAFWWRNAEDAFEKVVTQMLSKAKAAEAKERGHEFGPEFTITVTVRGHSSGVVSEGPGSPHSDADYTDQMQPVTVRAHNLRDALMLAAAEPLGRWFPDEEGVVTVYSPALDEWLSEEEADARWGKGHRPCGLCLRDDEWLTYCGCGRDCADTPVHHPTQDDALTAADCRLHGAENGPQT